MKTIQNSVFNNSPKLTNMIFPLTVTWVGSNAFSDCVLLKLICLSLCTPLNILSAYSSFGTRQSTALTLPSALETIGNRAFSNCEQLGMVNWSDLSNLKSIGQYGFYSCLGLVDVDLSNCTSLTTLDKSAFGSCKNINSLVFPASITSISGEAFNYGKDALTSVDMSADRKSVANGKSVKISVDMRGHGVIHPANTLEVTIELLECVLL